MITLRDNQVEPIRKAIEFFNEKNPKPSLIVLPTAWGKSILTAYVAMNTNDKLLVLQPSKELLEQNINKYYALCDDILSVHAGIYSASFNRREIGQITYATIGSICNLGEKFKKMGFTKMLIDEAHLYPREADSMLGRFLHDSGITHVLGITATPLKLQQGSVGMEKFSKLVMLTSRSKKGNFFKEIIHVGQIQEMVQLGYWAPLKYESVQFDGSLLVYNAQKSEFTEDSVLAAYQANGGLSRITETLDKHTERRHILVFCPSVSDAIEMSHKYPNSAVVYGDMNPHERARVIGEFREGTTRVIFNVKVLSTGFDYTGIDCIVLSRATASIPLYYQIIGRATRIDPAKKDALIVDLAGNVDRFGRVEDITFEKGSRIWRMFGSGGRLLSGIPVDQIGAITKTDVDRVEREHAQPITEMPFGKYKGQAIVNVSIEYRQWVLNNFTWTSKNARLRRSILATMQ